MDYEILRRNSVVVGEEAALSEGSSGAMRRRTRKRPFRMEHKDRRGSRGPRGREITVQNVELNARYMGTFQGEQGLQRETIC